MLAAVDAEEGLTGAEIARRLGVDPSAVSRALTELRDQELVDEDTTRSTDLGRAALREHLTRVLADGEFTTPEGWAELESLIGCRAAAVLRRRLGERGLEPPL